MVATWALLIVGIIAAFAAQTFPWSPKTLVILVLTGAIPVILFLIFITVSTEFPFQLLCFPNLTQRKTRHIQITARKRSTQWQDARNDKPTKRKEGREYYLFVLGSGGHTKEMLMMMDDGTHDFSHFHRRYIISSSDTMSMNHLQEYEERLAQLCKTNQASPGTYDTKVVTRARRVHQSLLTTPFSALLSINDIVPALRAPPPPESGKDFAKAMPYPSLVFSNGPATSFFVAAVIHALKVFYIVPEDCMRFVYIESWARISTLSLTGKLFYYTGLADRFVVQHSQVAEKYKLENAGQMVFNTRRLVD